MPNESPAPKAFKPDTLLESLGKDARIRRLALDKAESLKKLIDTGMERGVVRTVTVQPGNRKEMVAAATDMLGADKLNIQPSFAPDIQKHFRAVVTQLLCNLVTADRPIVAHFGRMKFRINPKEDLTNTFLVSVDVSHSGDEHHTDQAFALEKVQLAGDARHLAQIHKLLEPEALNGQLRFCPLPHDQSLVRGAILTVPVPPPVAIVEEPNDLDLFAFNK